MSAFEDSVRAGRAVQARTLGRDNGIVSAGVVQCCWLGMAGRVKGDTYRTSPSDCTWPCLPRADVSRQITTLERRRDAITIDTSLHATALPL